VDVSLSLCNIPKREQFYSSDVSEVAVAPVLGGVVVILFLSFYLSANPDPVVGWIDLLPEN